MRSIILLHQSNLWVAKSNSKRAVPQDFILTYFGGRHKFFHYLIALERLMKLRASLCVILALLLAVSTQAAYADVPENLCPPADCEYLVKDFSGQYPSDEERAKGYWQCYDAKSKTSVACTFVRDNAIEKYSDVYRIARSGGAQYKYCIATCGRLTDYMSQVYCKSDCCKKAGGTVNWGTCDW